MNYALSDELVLEYVEMVMNATEAVIGVDLITLIKPKGESDEIHITFKIRK